MDAIMDWIIICEALSKKFRLSLHLTVPSPPTNTFERSEYPRKSKNEVAF